jgi:hypothetical protein
MNRRYRILISTSLIMLVLLACTISIGAPQPQAPAAPTLSPQDLVNIAVAQTVAANQPAQPPAQPPVVATTQAPPPPPGPTAPPTPTPLPCNWALPVSETYPDGSNLNINTNFVKTWRIRNGGTCTWNTNYKAIFHSGTSMNGPATLNFTQIVHPGETYDIVMTLKAPASPGSYKGTWHLYGDDNIDFTKNGVWVLINAVNPAAAFAVSGVSFAVDNPGYAGPCPHKFNFTAGITATAAGTVTYYWTRSDGAHGPTQTLVYAGPGTKYVTTSWQIGADYSGWQKIYVDNPNHQTFGTAAFTLNCIP